MSKISIMEVLQIPYKNFEPDIIIPEAALECLHRWGKNAMGNERTPDSYTITFVYEGDGIENKWMRVEAKWEMTESEQDYYKKYCAELDAQKNKPLTIKRK